MESESTEKETKVYKPMLTYNFQNFNFDRIIGVKP